MQNAMPTPASVTPEQPSPEALTKRPPQQARSRKSQTKVLKAAWDILAEEGYDGLTLQKVSRKSGVSIGSIYGRFTGKEELVRVVHAVLMEDLEIAHQALLDPERWRDTPLNQLIPELFGGFADILREYAPVLRPMMLRATQDPHISDSGTQSYRRFITLAMQVLLLRADQVRRDNPAEALRFSLFAAFSVYRNHLGFGSDKGEMPDAEWHSIKHETSVMALAYLGA